MSGKKLGYFDVSMIVVSLVIGMGIFRTPVNVAASAASVSVFYTAWIIGGLIALAGALSFAEIGSRLPVSGGYYRIFSACYHPSVAFMLNGAILVSNAASVTGVALIGAEYISGVLFPESSSSGSIQPLIALGEILLFFGVNLLGLKTSARLQNVLTVFKIVMVIVLCMAVFSAQAPEPTTTPITTEVSGWKDLLFSLGVCLIPISFTYGGYQQTINFGSEVNDAPRVMPRAIITGISIVLLLYIAINYVYIQVIGFEELKHAENIASVLATHIFGAAGSKVLTLLLFFSVLAYVNVGLMSNPRVITAMSADSTLPSVFMKQSRKRNVPVASLTLFTLLCVLVLLFARAFDQIVSYVIFLDSIGLIAAVGTLFILRKRKTGEDGRIYRTVLYPLIPLVFIAGYGFVTFSITRDDPSSALYGMILFTCFYPLYWLFRKLARKNSTPEGVK